MSTDHVRASLAPQFPLRVLLVEDNPVDAELCIEFLSVAQFEVTADVVQDPTEFVSRIQNSTYDVIIADYAMGSWSGIDAFDLLQNEGLDIPFILLTAALGDTAAVDCIKRGLTDYVLKNRMERLPVAIYRALEQKAARNERRLAQREVQEVETKFRALAEISSDAIFVEQGGRCVYVNPAAASLTGFSERELVQMTFWKLIPESFRRDVYGRHRRSGESAIHCQTKVATKSAGECWVDCRIKVLQIDGRLGSLITVLPMLKFAEQTEKAERPAPVHASKSCFSAKPGLELTIAAAAV